MSSSTRGHGKIENYWGGLRLRSPWFGVATFLQGLTLLRYHVNCVVQLIMARHISCLSKQGCMIHDLTRLR